MVAILALQDGEAADEAAGPQPAPPQAEQDSGDPSVPAEESWAEKNAKQRARALEWIRRSSLPHVMLIRIVLEPLRQLLARHFTVAGAAFEFKELVRAAKFLQSGAPAGFKRRYHLRVAADHVLEDECRDFVFNVYVMIILVITSIFV